MSDKQALRTAIRRSRERDGPTTSAQRTLALQRAAPDVAAAAGPALAAFQPTNDEPDIGPLARALTVPVYLPRTMPHRRLAWAVAQAEDFVGRRSGIPVPCGPVVATEAGVAELGIGAILVPALAVDPRTGTRLGYGAGYYDRLLALLPARVLVVGVCRDQDLVSVPDEPHDIAMTAVLTESGLRRIGSDGDGAHHAWTA